MGMTSSSGHKHKSHVSKIVLHVPAGSFCASDGGLRDFHQVMEAKKQLLKKRNAKKKKSKKGHNASSSSESTASSSSSLLSVRKSVSDKGSKSKSLKDTYDSSDIDIRVFFIYG
jgi:hypothetical protein